MAFTGDSRFTLTVMMTSTQVVETAVNVTSSLFQDFTHPGDDKRDDEQPT